MKYCPKCQLIAEDTDSPVCASCGGVLEARDRTGAEDPDSLVVLKWCSGIEEAEVLKLALEAAGIESVVEDEPLLSIVSPYDGRGGATDSRVMIRLADAEAALDLLRRKESGELTVTDADVDAAEAEDEGETPP